MEEARARFESKLQLQENGCINWTGCLVRGYGHFKINSKNLKAHRIAWLLAGNTIPNGFILRHKCKQNRACCNVEHLEIGTHKQNGEDKIRDGTATRGEYTNTSKLTDEIVIKIRARANEGYRVLAEEFGVYQGTIGHIIRRESWTHL